MTVSASPCACPEVRLRALGYATSSRGTVEQHRVQVFVRRHVERRYGQCAGICARSFVRARALLALGQQLKELVTCVCWLVSVPVGGHRPDRQVQQRGIKQDRGQGGVLGSKRLTGAWLGVVVQQMWHGEAVMVALDAPSSQRRARIEENRGPTVEVRRRGGCSKSCSGAASGATQWRRP